MEGSTATASQQSTERRAAEKLREKWGCGRSGKRSLPRTQEHIARAFEKLVGLTPNACEGCPFEGVYHGNDGGWLAELLGARALVIDEGLAWFEALERPLAAVDVAALRVWKAAAGRLTARSLKPEDA